MKLESNDLESAKYLKKIDQDLKTKIAQKESEIERVKELYDRKLDDTQKIGEEAYANRIEQNNQRIVAATQDAETKLKGYQEHLAKTKYELETEEKSLKDAHDLRVQNIRLQNEDSISNMYQDSNDLQNIVQMRTSNEVKNLNNRAKNEIKNLETQTNREISALNSNFSSKTVDAERDFRNRLNEDLEQHRAQLNLSKDEFKKGLTLETEKNQRLQSEKARVYADELTQQETYHRNLMEQKDKDFKVRYENMTKEHEQILTDIKKQLDEEVQKLKLSTETNKKNISDKLADPFYRIETIEPKVVDQGTNYLVHIKVPEHEKDDVHLVAHGRGLKVTLSKKFSDLVTEEDGSVNRSSKTQLYSKEVKVADLLNPKNIQAKYENGTLTFKVQKA